MKEDRAITLLKAAHELLGRQVNTGYVINVLYETTFYDGTDCDGFCLVEDIKDLLDELEDVNKSAQHS